MEPIKNHNIPDSSGLILLIMGEKSGMNANCIQKQDIAKN